MIIFSTLVQHILLSDGKKIIAFVVTAFCINNQVTEPYAFSGQSSVLLGYLYCLPNFLLTLNIHVNMSLQPFPEVSCFCGLVGSTLTVNLFSRHFADVIVFYFL